MIERNSILLYSIRTFLRVGDLLFPEMESLSQTGVCSQLPTAWPRWFSHTKVHQRVTWTRLWVYHALCGRILQIPSL